MTKRISRQRLRELERILSEARVLLERVPPPDSEEMEATFREPYDKAERDAEGKIKDALTNEGEPYTAGTVIGKLKGGKNLGRDLDDAEKQAITSAWNNATRNGTIRGAAQTAKKFMQDYTKVAKTTPQPNQIQDLVEKAVAYFEQQRGEGKDVDDASVQRGRAILSGLRAQLEKGPQDVIDAYNALQSDQEKKDLKNALRRGLQDGNKTDDIAGGVRGMTKCSELYPTQNEIDATKSIAYPLGSGKTFRKTLIDGVGTAPEIACANAGDKKYVLDGHHRWSSSYVVNPEAEIKTWMITFPEGVPENDGSGYLAMSQLAILTAVPGADNVPSSQTSPAFNLLDTAFRGKPKEIYKKIANASDMQTGGEMGPYCHYNNGWMQEMKPVKDDACAKMHPTIKGQTYSTTGHNDLVVPDDLQAFKDMCNNDEKYGLSCMAYVSENCANLNTFGNKANNPRGIMPQFDHPNVGDDAGKYQILNRLAKGKTDIVEARSRWQKLAGILKD